MAKLPTMTETAKKLAEAALDDVEIDGKSLREWISILNADKVKVAKWIPKGCGEECSNCGAWYEIAQATIEEHMNYCPNCGKRMGGAEQEAIK